MVSLLTHVTVVPVDTMSGFVPKLAAPRVLALVGIDTVADPPVEVCGGVVDDGDEEELPHAAAAAARAATIRILRNAIRLLNGSVSGASTLRKPIAERCV